MKGRFGIVVVACMLMTGCGSDTNADDSSVELDASGSPVDGMVEFDGSSGSETQESDVPEPPAAGDAPSAAAQCG